MKCFDHNNKMHDIIGHTVNTFLCAVSLRIFMMQTKVKI